MHQPSSHTWLLHQSLTEVQHRSTYSVSTPSISICWLCDLGRYGMRSILVHAPLGMGRHVHSICARANDHLDTRQDCGMKGHIFELRQKIMHKEDGQSVGEITNGLNFKPTVSSGGRLPNGAGRVHAKYPSFCPSLYGPAYAW